MLYDIIYADPAWVYKDKAKAGKRGAESKYNCTPTEEMGRLMLPVSDNAVCAMWCTNPMIEEGLKLLNLWDFKYKTILFHWIKTNKDGTVFMGMGNHTRANAEICMLGVRGKGIKRYDASVMSTQLQPREQHSKKPDKFRTDIVKLWGEVPRIELFAREHHIGWACWGDEIESDIKIDKVPE